ncbi:MAG: COR domain-containing protein [Spirochaetota bacterium]|nr:COR domain-containing protein [Spirochaetota bacterium]
MTDLERIQTIEEILGYKLKQVEPEKIAQKDFYAPNPFDYSLSYLLSPKFPYKGSRSYCINRDDSIVGLALDYAPCFLLPQDILAGFRNITFLSLRSADISDVSFLKELKGLTGINLSNNSIKAFEPWLAEKGLDIRIDNGFSIACINLYGNPLESPPLDVVEQGNAAVRKYFIDIGEEGTDYIYEAKLLILGESGAGKTSLARKIIDINADLPKEEETTHGIDVDTWQFPYSIHDLGEKGITANIWDFGGQAIYKATHRFFLSHRSLYAIVADARKVNTDFYYWMHTVELFGEESPVLIVINEMEDRKRDLPYHNLRTRFDILQDKRGVNFKKPDNRLNDLIDKLKYEISHLQHIGDPIPANWKRIRDDIANTEETDKVITLKDYRKICRRHKLVDYKDQDIVCQYFHDLGVFLHFRDNDVLNHIIFLDKEWILDGAYKIIDDPELAEKKGRFTREDIEKIFDDEYTDYISEIIAMMKKFYLVYENDNFIIAPQMLPYDAPDYKWDSKENIQFNFVYESFMPAGILWQFIVEMKDEIKDELVWRYGVVLDFGDTLAEVIEVSESKLIQIRVRGKRREDIRAVIIRKIEVINRQFKKLKTQKLVPCVCSECKGSEKPHLFEYETLINAKAARQQISHLPCLKSFHNVDIDKLLSGIEFLEKEKSISEKEARIKKITIFLASSAELEKDRREFRIFISEPNKHLIKDNIFLELEIWEDFVDAMSKTRLQDEYNNAVRNSDIFVMLFFTKVGRFTLEEFETAFGQFKKTKKPLIYTYFKNAPFNTGDLKEQDTQSIFAFQKKLKELGHYQTVYKNIDDLKLQFDEQLKKVLPGL